MPTGRIVDIVKSDGYGFIIAQDGTRVFFHQRWMGNAKFRDLKLGEEVIFKIESGPRGRRAHKLDLLADVPPEERNKYNSIDIVTERRNRESASEIPWLENGASRNGKRKKNSRSPNGNRNGRSRLGNILSIFKD